MKKNLIGLLLAIATKEHAKAKKGNKASWQSVINRLTR
jgi:hypothetical protein